MKFLDQLEKAWHLMYWELDLYSEDFGVNTNFASC